MSLEVWRRNSHYFMTMIYVVINLVHGKIGPLEKQNQMKQVTGPWWWILSCNGCCAWFCHWLFLSLKLCQSLFWSLGSKREIEKFSNNSNVPSFAICLCNTKWNAGGGWKQWTCLKIVTKGCPLFERCRCSLDVNLWSFISPRLQVQMKLVFFFPASSNSPETWNFGSCL